jgi:hypothetical protein
MQDAQPFSCETQASKHVTAAEKVDHRAVRLTVDRSDPKATDIGTLAGPKQWFQQRLGQERMLSAEQSSMSCQKYIPMSKHYRSSRSSLDPNWVFVRQCRISESAMEQSAWGYTGIYVALFDGEQSTCLASTKSL